MATVTSEEIDGYIDVDKVSLYSNENAMKIKGNEANVKELPPQKGRKKRKIVEEPKNEVNPDSNANEDNVSEAGDSIQGRKKRKIIQPECEDPVPKNEEESFAVVPEKEPEKEQPKEKEEEFQEQSVVPVTSTPKTRVTLQQFEDDWLGISFFSHSDSTIELPDSDFTLSMTRDSPAIFYNSNSSIDEDRGKVPRRSTRRQLTYPSDPINPEE